MEREMVCLWQERCRVTGVERRRGRVEGCPGAWITVRVIYTAGGGKTWVLSQRARQA